MIALIGATGRSGAALAHALDCPFRAVVRDAERWRAMGIAAPHAVAALEDAAGLRNALEGAELVVSCAHARHAPAILAATGAPVVLMGSTRRHSRWPDAHGDGVRAGEAAFRTDGRPGVMLHPTMIYGAQGEDNVQRLAALMRRLPVLPLPGGGQALVQPIHQGDVTRSLLAAIRIAHQAPRVLDVAGPEPLPYREFCAEVARAAGFAPRPVLPVPAGLLMAVAPLARLLLPRIGRDEIRRLTEDKAFNIAAMREALGVHPIPLAEGLRLTFA
ncbi:NAD(P)H-binding protein [Sabulicella glaciei]|uniref:NADH-ubiquinone oxidoreductase n=1 Tax=Sabulicella glaciei TaxID=2984948 RepID=A0ABT3NQV4_9PROT|nr:NADH-ubiquinone oxidoreductase [Roseococcus sp. MDT2-1-1]MCW8084543.1 NADH-ubiquinone oxidoreductase [Roseococcus sp. MDT2-1-1]